MTDDFSPEEQMERLDAQIEELSERRRHIADNLYKWAAESDEEMTDRLRKARIRYGLREARFRITGSRSSSPDTLTIELAIFEYVYDRCRVKQTLWRFDGRKPKRRTLSKLKGYRFTPISETKIADAVGCTERYARDMLRRLDRGHRLFVRDKKDGLTTGYAISLPDARRFEETVLSTIELRADRLSAASDAEGILDDLEPATTPSLAYLRQPDHKPASYLQAA